MLVEAERLRPNLEELLAEASFVSTSAKFPHVRLTPCLFWRSGMARPSRAEFLPVCPELDWREGARGCASKHTAAPALCGMGLHYSRRERGSLAAASATRGSQRWRSLPTRVVQESYTAYPGCLVPVHRCETVLLAEQLALQDLLRQMWEELDRRKAEAGAEPACTTANGMQIRFPSSDLQSEHCRAAAIQVKILQWMASDSKLCSIAGVELWFSRVRRTGCR